GPRLSEPDAARLSAPGAAAARTYGGRCAPAPSVADAGRPSGVRPAGRAFAGGCRRAARLAAGDGADQPDCSDGGDRTAALATIPSYSRCAAAAPAGRHRL